MEAENDDEDEDEDDDVISDLKADVDLDDDGNGGDAVEVGTVDNEDHDSMIVVVFLTVLVVNADGLLKKMLYSFVKERMDSMAISNSG